jgi:hypothetical protein
VKRRDLVVVEVGGDEGLRRELLVEHAHVLQVHVARVQPAAVRLEIVTDRRHRRTAGAEQPRL